MPSNISYVNSNQACELCARYVPTKMNMRYSLTKCNELFGQSRRGCRDACRLCNNKFKMDQPHEGFIRIPFQMRYNHVNSYPIYENNGSINNTYVPYSSNNGNVFLSTYRNSEFNLPRLIPLEYGHNYRPYY